MLQSMCCVFFQTQEVLSGRIRGFKSSEDRYYLVEFCFCCSRPLSLIRHTLCFSAIIRLHRSTTYIDAAYFYRPSSVVCRSVCHTSEPCKNGCTDRAAVWVEDLGGPGEPCIRLGPDPPMRRGKFLGENGRPIVKYRDTLRSSVQRRLNR